VGLLLGCQVRPDAGVALDLGEDTARRHIVVHLHGALSVLKEEPSLLGSAPRQQMLDFGTLRTEAIVTGPIC
jgi:hypothetical protein